MPEDHNEVTHAVLAERIRAVRDDIGDMEDRFKDHLQIIVFEEFKKALDQRIVPLERVVYGLVGIVLLAVMGAVIALVVTGNPAP